MSVIWSGVTEEGAVVPVQVTNEGKVVAVGDGPQGDYLPITGGTLTGDLKVLDKVALNVDGSAEFAGGEVEIRSSGEIVTNRAGAGSLFSIRRAGVEGLNIQSDGQLKLGGVVGSVPNITLNADGSGTFAKRVSAVGLSSTGGSILADRTSADDVNFLNRLNGTGTGRWQADGTIMLGGTQSGSTLTPNITLQADGKATFADNVSTTNGVFYATRSSGSGKAFVGRTGADENAIVYASGAAEFAGDVIIGSRGDKWLIRESNGVAMLVQQSREATPMTDVSPMTGVSPMIPEKVRDIPSELDLIEMALNEVMEKLRMTPPAGWPVWDGSDNP